MGRSLTLDLARVRHTGGVQGELRVRLLGGLDVEGLEPAACGSRKARTLLARLALGRGRAVELDAAIDAVWPEGPLLEPASSWPFS